MNKKLLVSACLLGINSKYNGEDNKNNFLVENCNKLDIIPVCPEQLGGLATPRAACEITNCLNGKDVLAGKGQVIDKNGKDLTKEFILGAQQTLNIAKLQNVVYAILKKRSPSCGCGQIYDGTFSSKLHSGNGVTAELLQENGIKVFNEDDITAELINNFAK